MVPGWLVRPMHMRNRPGTAALPPARASCHALAAVGTHGTPRGGLVVVPPVVVGVLGAGAPEEGGIPSHARRSRDLLVLSRGREGAVVCW